MAGLDWRRFGVSVPEVVKTVIGDQYRLYGRVLPDETDLFSDLGAVDAIEVTEVLMTMEELFSLRFAPETTTRVRTAGHVVDLVEAELARLQPNSSTSPAPPP